MPELSSPDLAEVSWAQCPCDRCEDRRRKENLAPGCPCPECQPGPGVDHLGNRHRLTVQRKTRMNTLLAIEWERLTTEEQGELNDLISIYLHSG